MPHVCFVSTVHPVHDHRFLYKMCQGLLADGCEVSFIVGHDRREDVIKGVRVRGLSRREKRLARFTGGLSLLPKLLSLRADAYHLCDVELLPVGLVMKVFFGYRVVYDAHEDMRNFIRHKTWLPTWLRPVIGCGIGILESLADAAFDGIVTADPGVWAQHKAAAPARKVIYYNFPNLRLFGTEPPPLSERPYDVVLLGSMSRTSGLFVLLEALSILRRNRDVSLLLIGEPFGDVRSEFYRVVSDRGLGSAVHVTGRVRHEEVPAWLYRGKIGTICLLDMPKFHSNIAVKMFEYWAAAMPVVSSDLPPERRFIREGVDGILYPPGDPEGLAEAVGKLLDDLQTAERMGLAGRRRVLESLNDEQENKKLQQFYRRILKG